MSRKKDEVLLNVMVVEDADQLRTLLCDELKFEGHNPIPAKGGLEAIQILGKQSIDVIISDVRMSEGNGVELLKIIRQDPGMQKVTVMLMTGFADITTEDAYAQGAECLLPKPLDIDYLLQRIARCNIPRKKLWQDPKYRINTESIFNFTFSSLEEAISSGHFNIGTGGFFFTNEKVSPSDHQFNFKIVFEDPEKSILEGSAITRWARNKNNVDNLPAGVGAEILYLTNGSYQVFESLLSKVNPSAYIPKQ